MSRDEGPYADELEAQKEARLRRLHRAASRQKVGGVRTVYEDGWCVIGDDGQPLRGSFEHRREDARIHARSPTCGKATVAKCRRILAWQKP